MTDREIFKMALNCLLAWEKESSGQQYDPRREPSGSWVSWENTMCNPLADARMQTQSAWKDGYNSAKKEWVGLTDSEKKDICQEAANEDWTDLDVINATEAKLKEKTHEN